MSTRIDDAVRALAAVLDDRDLIDRINDYEGTRIIPLSER